MRQIKCELLKHVEITCGRCHETTRSINIVRSGGGSAQPICDSSSAHTRRSIVKSPGKPKVASDQQNANPVGEGFGRSLWRLLLKDGQAIPAAVSTVVVEVGVFAGARVGGVDPRNAVLCALATATLWTILAAPAFAAAGRSALGALISGGVVADASLVMLAVLWLTTEYVTFAAGVKIYCILVALVLASVAAVRLARTSAGRYAAAAAMAAVMTTAAASYFWIGGLLNVMLDADRWRGAYIVASSATRTNPFAGVCAAVAERTDFVWHESGMLYDITRVGDFVPAGAKWYYAVVVWLAVAGILVAAGLIRRRPAQIGPPQADK